MLSKLLFLAALFLMPLSFAGDLPSNAATWMVGGRGAGNSIYGQPSNVVLPFSDKGTIMLIGSNVSTGGHFHGFQKAGGTSQSQYQVTAGKTFYVVGLYWTNGGSAQSNCGFGQSSAALATDDTTSVPAGEIYYTTAPSSPTDWQDRGGFIFAAGSGFTPAYSDTYTPLTGMTFTASYYPFWGCDGEIGGQTQFRLLGYEN